MIETEIVTFPLLVFSQLEECRKNAATFFKKVIHFKFNINQYLS